MCALAFASARCHARHGKRLFFHGAGISMPLQKPLRFTVFRLRSSRGTVSLCRIRICPTGGCSESGHLVLKVIQNSLRRAGWGWFGGGNQGVDGVDEGQSGDRVVLSGVLLLFFELSRAVRALVGS
jgi:hypothetical protein